jgi:lysozyme family protein
MASFKDAFKKTMKHEGGYVDDPEDAGGETYQGVSRKYHPTWSGWEIIDKAKSENDFSHNLARKASLKKHVKAFYRMHYWDKILGDLIPEQNLADTLFDIAVNMGVTRSGKFLQQSLNYLNRNQRLYPDLVDDGLIGRKTLYALEKYLENDKIEILYKIIMVLRGMHYLNYMRKSPIQEKFCRGWFSRVNLI